MSVKFGLWTFHKLRKGRKILNLLNFVFATHNHRGFDGEVVQRFVEHYRIYQTYIF